MKKLPDIFKPGINKQLNNNSKVYYSNNNESRSDNNIKPKKNIKKIVLQNNHYNKEVTIVTSKNTFNAKIVDRMGNNIITDDGKIISQLDILEIYDI